MYLENLNISNLDYLDRGSQGTIYKKDDLIYKLYRTDKYNFRGIPRSIKHLLGNESKNILFPIEEILDDDRLVGYVAKYVKSNNLYNGFDLNTNVNNIIKAYYEILEEIKKYSFYRMDDLYNRNILFDNNRFYIIDTDDWKYSNNSVNSYLFDSSIRIELLSSLKLDKNSIYYKINNFKINNDLNKLYNTLLDNNFIRKYNGIKILEYLIDYYYKMGINIEKLSDFNRIK